MKRTILLTVLLTLVCSFIFAQSGPPKGFAYQAIILKDGKALQEANVKVKVTLQDENGKVYLIEEHSALKTSASGLVNLTVGKGTASQGTIDNVPWESGIFIKIDTDLGEGYKSLGAAQLLSVPYALHANMPRVIRGKAGSEEPIFEIQNSDGKPMLTVSNSGVQIIVPDNNEPAELGTEVPTRGVRGGFIVASRNGEQVVNRMVVGGGSVGFAVDEMDEVRGVRGGFIVASRRNTASLRGAEADNLTGRLIVSGANTHIIVDPALRGVRGGFIVANRNMEEGLLRGGAEKTTLHPILGKTTLLPANLSKTTLMVLDDRASYFTLHNKSGNRGSFSFRDRENAQKVLLNFTPEGKLEAPTGDPNTVITAIPTDPNTSMLVEFIHHEFTNAERWVAPTVKFKGQETSKYILKKIPVTNSTSDNYEIRYIYTTGSSYSGTDLGTHKIQGIVLKKNTEIPISIEVCLEDYPTLCVTTNTKMLYRDVYLDERCFFTDQLQFAAQKKGSIGKVDLQLENVIHKPFTIVNMKLDIKLLNESESGIKLINFDKFNQKLEFKIIDEEKFKKFTDQLQIELQSDGIKSTKGENKIVLNVQVVH